MTTDNNKNITKLIEKLLQEVGEDPTREGLLKTPARVAKSWAYFSRGYNQDLDYVVNNAIFHETSKDMIVVRDVEFFSHCEHHLLPFFGKAHVGYIPNGKMIGLSKIPRIIDMYARRLQVQERLTHQIADAIKEVLKPSGVAVVLEGRHMCMQLRGVEKQNSLATTSTMLGKFRESVRTRNEFMYLINRPNI